MIIIPIYHFNFADNYNSQARYPMLCQRPDDVVPSKVKPAAGAKPKPKAKSKPKAKAKPKAAGRKKAAAAKPVKATKKTVKAAPVATIEPGAAEVPF